MSFKEVVPGVLVNEDSGIEVSIPHPDPCWIIRNPDKSASMSNGRSLYIFSSDEKARFFMKDMPKSEFLLEEYIWNELVDKFDSQYKDAIVDHEGKAGFYAVVPLKEGI